MVLLAGRLLCVMSAFFFSFVAFSDFLPPNDLHLEDFLESDGGITEEEFNSIIDQVEEVYGPIIKELGGKLAVSRNWETSTVNASAQRFFGTWRVNMYGGLARRPEITPDGFTMVLCHELGHHVAGFPRTSSWAANEGQSDYYASLSCGRVLWEGETELNEKAADIIPEYPKSLCDEQFFDDGIERVHLCYREMMAGNSTARLLGALGGTEVEFDTPDPAVVDRTDNRHPRGQCRMDTYMAGALCDRSFDISLIPGSEEEAAEQSCHQVNGDTEGLRPRCWFKPDLERGS